MSDKVCTGCGAALTPQNKKDARRLCLDCYAAYNRNKVAASARISKLRTMRRAYSYDVCMAKLVARLDSVKADIAALEDIESGKISLH